MLMKIACLGGGAAGLYFAISMKLRHTAHEITVYERNKPGDTFGWGVVFSDETMARLSANDPVSASKITGELAHWDDIKVTFNGQAERSSGHGFCGIGRKRLLSILQDRAIELGVDLQFEVELDGDRSQFQDFDLLIASDGVNSRFRDAQSDHFAVDVDLRKNKYIWLGTPKTFDAFEFIFVELPEGLIWAHAYQFDASNSTFIVECDEATWKALAFEQLTQNETCSKLEGIFADHLDGAPLMTNAKHLRGSAWLQFPRLLCGKWSSGNLVLMGDAAHTAHFSIGSGTKLALEDAISLAEHINRTDDLSAALGAYETERRVEVLKLQNAARNSTEWFETLHRYTDFHPIQFNYSLLTRSQRVSHENLRVRDPASLERAEHWFAQSATNDEQASPRPPMFTPFDLREVTLSNRVVVAPIMLYSAVEGELTNFHHTHYTARALGGAGLIITEALAVAPEARVTPGCAGLYSVEQTEQWRRITDFAHTNTNAKLCAQISHCGPKGATEPGWKGYDIPLPSDAAWPLLSPSGLVWKKGSHLPREMTEADMDEVIQLHVAATHRADAAGFDMIELHCGHGNLLSSFLTPLTNRREDAYGGDVIRRMRFPLEVFRAMREAWPVEKPMAVRISATDWCGPDGNEAREGVIIAKAFYDAGCDLLDVSTGETSPDAKPVYGRMYQTPYSDQIRNELCMPTMAVGAITDADQANSILLSGRADLIGIGRPHLADPNWTLRAAASLSWREPNLPLPYKEGIKQLSQAFRK